MANEQQALAAVILRDPAVESLSSFIGIDGTNATLNSGRILINLKPLEERKVSASEVIGRLQPELAKVAGIHLFLQPVQDLSVDARVSRTQFQYTMEDPDANELYTWAPRLVDALSKRPELRDVSSDQQDRASGSTSPSTGARPPASASCRSSSTTPSMMLTGSGWYRPSSPSSTSTASSSASSPIFSRTRES